MTTFSIIQKSQLEGALRIDAEFYQPEYFIDFSKGIWKSIGNVIKNCQYGLSLAMNDEKKGYPMFKMDDINDAFLLDADVRYADVKKNELGNFKLEYNDVLFNRVNSEEFVGRTGVFKLNTESIFASYLIRLQVNNNSEIMPDYLNIFLNSKFGLKQIKRYSRRAVNQANVNAEELKQFKIAILPKDIQKEIENLSNESWNNFQSSKKLYQQAESLLLEELELKDLSVEENLSAIVNFSDILEARRMDAEYFQPKYEKLISILKYQKSKLLSEVIENVPAKFNPLAEPDKLFKYVELSNIDSSIGLIDGFSETSGREAPGRAKRILKTGDVIVSSVEGSLGKVALADREQEDHLASTGFFQFRSEYILPEVILVLAKSIVFQMQLEKQCAGTILTAVPKEAINNIYVPILPKSTQQKISELVRQSHEVRKKAKELLEEAKRKAIIEIPENR
ncbi:MAG: restriction endonuclease subunit S [Candidatus Moranbacteria bacterium]|nr:restriction endonuclease subunit S [Candidatus Moranbacteria bacterium]